MLLYPIFSLQVSIEGIPFTPVESLREDVQLHEPIVFLYYSSNIMRTCIAHDLIGDIIREPLLQNIDHFHLYIYIYILKYVIFLQVISGSKEHFKTD